MTCWKYLCLEAELSSLFSGKHWNFLQASDFGGHYFLGEDVWKPCPKENCENKKETKMCISFIWAKISTVGKCFQWAKREQGVNYI